MAAPVDAGRVGYSGSTAATTHNVTMPGSISSGDLLVCVLRCPNLQLPGSGEIPSNWTQLIQYDGDASNDRTWVYYKVASGSEGSTESFTFQGGASDKLAAATWRITGGGTPVATSAATGTSTAPNPPVTPSLTGDHLFLWVGGWEGEQTSPPSGTPTNYSNAVAGDTGTAGSVATNCRVAGASRQRTGLSSQTEDPPSWTISASDDWSAWTIYIPAAGPTEHQGSFTLDLSPSIAVNVFRSTTTSFDRNLSPSIDVAAVRQTFTGFALDVSPSVAVAAIRETLAGVTFPVDLAIAVAAVRETFGGVTLPLGPGISVSVFKETFAGVTFPVDLTISVNATSSSGGQEHFASVTFPMNLVIDTAGVRETSTGFSQDFSPSIAVAAIRETFGGVSVSLNIDFGVLATRQTFTAISDAVELAIVTAVTRQTFGGVTFPLDLQITTNAVIEGQQVIRNRSLLGVGK